jgi:hypothetical protein
MLQLRAELDLYLHSHTGETAQDADLIAGALDLTTTCARVVVADAASLSADVNSLIRKWILEPDALSQTLARADWLLDGWDRIVALWESASAHLGQEATLSEMCNLVPAVPREIGSWVSHQLNIETDLQRHRRKVILLEDWRTGRNVIDVIGRNETLLEHAG